GDHAGVDEKTDLVLHECPGPDVPLDQERVRLEVRLVEDRDLGRLERGLDPLHVDLAVAGHTDAEQFPFPARFADLEHDVLERVRGCHLPTEVSRVRPRHQGVDGRGVRGVMDDGRGEPVDRPGGGRRGDDGLDMGGVPTIGGPHERVLARLGDREELLRGRSAHRSRGGRTDLVLDPQPVEDALIGRPVLPVGPFESGVVEVEGVRVLHGELAATQIPARGRSSSRYLVWIWYSVTGRSLYGEYSPCPVRVEVSSCVGPSITSLPLRSVNRNSSDPYSVQRPLVSYGSRGRSAGRLISWAPEASISSRTTCSTLRRVRRPSGSHE